MFCSKRSNAGQEGAGVSASSVAGLIDPARDARHAEARAPSLH
jgi:hypothetical protein